MFCNDCGTANRDNAAFCTNCGKPLNSRPVDGMAPRPREATAVPASGFVSDTRAPAPEADYAAIATASLAFPPVTKINKKFLKTATPEQLAAAVGQSLAAGAKPDWMKKNLVKQGVEADRANRIVTGITQAMEEYKRTPEGRKVMGKKYRYQMVGGFTLFVIGTAITVGTFMAADDGGTYFLWWGGPIILGAIGFFTGLVGWMKYRSG